jgi:hypothetical protein
MTDATPSKRCPDCRETKPVTEFYPRRLRGPNGRQSRCQTCSNRSRVRHRQYRGGFTRQLYMELLVTQCGLCALCGGAETAGAARPRIDGAVRSLNGDHDHLTGKPRALLCSRCNTALGLLGDDPDLLRRAAEYIEEYRNG